MSSLTQALILAEQDRGAPGIDNWVFSQPYPSGMVMSTGATNFESIFPGTQDFCFEVFVRSPGWYNTPALLVGWGSGGNASGPAGSNFVLTYTTDGTNYSLQVSALGTTSTNVASLPLSSAGFWTHIAMSRSGSTINVWANGQLMSQITGFSGDLTFANVGGDGWWFGTGPVGDRDQTYGFALSCAWRNMRYTIGDSVYGNVSSFTPPNVYTNFTSLPGTQFIWWPTTDSTGGNYYGFGSSWYPDYGSGTYTFNPNTGSTTSDIPDIAGYVDFGTTYTPVTAVVSYNTGYIAGTWTNPGSTNPSITNTGPSPLVGSYCGDFSASGTDVYITAGNSGLSDFSSTFSTVIWFYMPTTITNEVKTIISGDQSTSIKVCLGRTGQGIDWLSIGSTALSDLAYANHVWSRGAWNFLYFQQDENGVIGGWAGTYGETYAKNLNLVNGGGTGYGFANSGNVFIGGGVGVTSSQLYFNVISHKSGYFNSSKSSIYAADTLLIPVQYFAIRPQESSIMFTFQPTGGAATDIQPLPAPSIGSSSSS